MNLKNEVSMTNAILKTNLNEIEMVTNIWNIKKLKARIINEIELFEYANSDEILYIDEIYYTSGLSYYKMFLEACGYDSKDIDFSDSEDILEEYMSCSELVMETLNEYFKDILVDSEGNKFSLCLDTNEFDGSMWIAIYKKGGEYYAN
jgi:hypothetical protein